MKALLEFDMNLKNDKILHSVALNGDKYATIIYYLEIALKEYEADDHITIDQAQCYRKVSAKIAELKTNTGVTNENYNIEM